MPGDTQVSAVKFDDVERAAPVSSDDSREKELLDDDCAHVREAKQQLAITAAIRAAVCESGDIAARDPCNEYVTH